MADVRVLILPVYTGGDDFCSIDLAVVKLDDHLCRLILDRHEQVMNIVKQHPELTLYGADFWDNNCSWLGSPNGAPWQRDETMPSEDDDLAEEYLEEFGELIESILSRYVILQDERLTQLPERVYKGTECDCMVVTEHSVYWDAMPKHSDYHIVTGDVPIKEFASILATAETSATIGSSAV